MAETVILMRASLAEDDELREAKKHFQVFESRAALPMCSDVIGRYSCLPYFKELEADLAYHGSRLINNHAAHMYVADMANYYEDLKDLTPKTWFSLADFKNEPNKPLNGFVLKGQTNSKKNTWNSDMFASTASDVDVVYSRLSDDGFLSDQNIYIRQYVPLRQFGIGIRGLPITEEYRFFVLDGKVVGSGFYWSQFPEIKEQYKLSPEEVPESFLKDITARIGNKIRFYVVDVARTRQGSWEIIELNDGMCSGLSDVSPCILYENLRKLV